MRKFISVAFAGITTGMLTLFGITAEASTPRPSGDCGRVAAADYKLCGQVQRQHPYGVAFPEGGGWSAPSGKALVREFTHQGYTKGEIHSALVGEAKSYRDNVTAVPVNMDAIVKKCGTTRGQWIVELRDEDGHRGGVKLTHKFIVCP